jgi:hypothetical protein
MAVITVNNPYGGYPPMVDKRIGTAFAIVDLVAKNLETVAYVASNMEALVAIAAKNEIEATAYVTAVAGAIGVPVDIPYPTDVTNSSIKVFTVNILGTNGRIHVPSEYYTAEIISNNLRVTLGATAPSQMVGGTIRWHMIYTPPSA